MIAAAALLAGLSAPAFAAATDDDALLAYIRARAADVAGSPDEASRRYAAALAMQPGNDILAGRALAEGVASGDEALALRAAHALPAASLPPEAKILLAADALKRKDWAAAETAIARLDGDDVFTFAAPILRAWLAVGSGKGDPIVILDSAKASAPGGLYAPEQRGLILLASGHAQEGIAALEPLLKESGLHSQRLRIAAASLLAAKGDRAGAEAMLQGDNVILLRARQALAASGRLPGAIDTPAAGIANFLTRIAVDLNAQQVPQVALSFGRISTFLDPGNSEAWLLTAELLDARHEPDAALAALAHIGADDPLAGNAADRRLLVLGDSGRKDEGVALARAETAKQPQSLEAWLRLGDALTQTEAYAEAGDAYAHALALNGDGTRTGHPRWTLLLLQGNALTQAGKWPEAKAALQEAHKLAPHEAVVLNYLGYSQLERRQNIGEAETLIREASALQPDDSSITDSLGWAMYVKGDLPQAIELLEKAAQGQPADASINEHLGDAYYTAGRHYEARYAWRAALLYADGKAQTRLKTKIDTGLRPDLSAP
ncbi:MAG TPA: tetratricopeptide repeat protein [Allosphingosinicella sp.]|jgi:Flp pilus assembly protein TadD|nr:tetratricopeptide repeat protein [Allosphingosinicella sp.]